MKLKTLQNIENRRLLPVTAKTVVAIMLLMVAAGGAMAAGEPDAPADTKPATGLWDIIKWDDIVNSAKSVADGDFGTTIGLVLGIFALLAIVSILLGVFGGVSISNLGKVFGSNDMHEKGKGMLGVAVGSALAMVLGLVIIGLIFAKMG